MTSPSVIAGFILLSLQMVMAGVFQPTFLLCSAIVNLEPNLEPHTLLAGLETAASNSRPC